MHLDKYHLELLREALSLQLREDPFNVTEIHLTKGAEERSRPKPNPEGQQAQAGAMALINHVDNEIVDPKFTWEGKRLF